MTRETELATLNLISQALNQAVDVRNAMQFALENLLEAMELETGWIFLADESNQDRWMGRGYSLIATQNLPPGLALDQDKPWTGGCDCQGFCNTGKLTEAYNEVRCTRLRDASGDRRGLEIHASAPLKSGESVLGILNVAAPTWDAFS
ncbi:MAG: GAF domain-containing protein, partial [Anaerolineales bacterium]|nr:GAF domain-containing protein [Anaerolineales bacterium]